jgi:DNA-binding NarL/FixJ family response regulator
MDHEADIELIGEADNGYSAVEKIKAQLPDVSLIDVDMPGLSGIGVIRVLRKFFPKMKLIVLSTYSEEKYIQAAMEAGADGYVIKTVGIGELVKIIKSFCSGKPELSPYLVNLTSGYDSGKKRAGACGNYKLSVREKEILEIIAEGKGNIQIAEVLCISTETVKSHIKNIFRKLEVRNRVDAVRIAREKQLIF